MTAFDQSAERATVEARMLDTCRLTRDAQGVGDDTLNATTLELVPPVPTTIYEGPFSIAAYSGVGDENRTEGQREDTRQLWRGSLPITAGPPLYGDTLEVLSIHADGDTSLVGRRFTVVRIGAHTIGVRRTLVLQDE
jgi:hypothetical protein